MTDGSTRWHKVLVAVAAIIMTVVSVDAYKHYCVDLRKLAAEVPTGMDPPPTFTLPSLFVGLAYMWVPFVLLAFCAVVKRKPKLRAICIVGSLLLFVWGSLTILADIHDLDIPFVLR